MFLGKTANGPTESDMEVQKRWLKRCRVTHVAGHGRSLIGMGKELGHWRDTALDAIVYHLPSEPAVRVWSIIELEEPFPVARVVTRARTITDRNDARQPSVFSTTISTGTSSFL